MQTPFLFKMPILRFVKKIIVSITMVINTASISSNQFDPMNLDPNLRVKKAATPVSSKVLLQVLCESHTRLHGDPPEDNRLALSWAQVALENNRGKKVWNNNLGNQGPFRMNQEYYHHLRRGWPYRSFRSLHDSGISYWILLQRCSAALRAFDDGDPLRAAQSLKNCNYFSSDVDGYATSLRSLYYEIRKEIKVAKPCG